MLGENPVRVLVVAPLGVGGVTNMMIHIQSNMDREKVNFDYLVFHDRKEPCEDIVCGMGSKKLIASADHIQFKPLRRLYRINKIRKVCKENHVKILHYNADNAADLTNIIGAKLGGVKYITMHSHSAGYGTAGLAVRLVSEVLKPLIPLFCNYYWGCSHRAAQFVFPHHIIKSGKYTVLPNGIELEKYNFDYRVRNEQRKELGLENNIVIGHAGRFSAEKNHAFLLEIFKEIHRMNPKAVLLLFGVGKLMPQIKKRAEALKISNAVIFYGATSEMNKMWQAMDVFVMPSLYEGLPVTGIEAQASGLPCIFSDAITHEVDVSGESVFLPLSDSPMRWAEVALSIAARPRKDGISSLAKAGYDISEVSKKVQDFYWEIGQH